MKTIAIFFSLFILNFSFLSQENHTLSGYVMDGKTGEILIGAQVSIPSLKIASTTNSYGFYSLTVPEGKYELVISYLGYVSQTHQIDLKSNITLNSKLKSSNIKKEFSLFNWYLIEISPMQIFGNVYTNIAGLGK